jgi:diketogulonate reductase-like aldo/keto reductase
VTPPAATLRYVGITHYYSGTYEVRDKPLPAWTVEFDCASWAQFFLKFILSHPAVTCAIPATGKVTHLVENMQGGVGRLPDQATRERMAQHLRTM